jgi:hypothetical protein
LFCKLPRYVVNQVTAGDYDCPMKILKFLTELHVAFWMLNLRNDFLRKKIGDLGGKWYILINIIPGHTSQRYLRGQLSSELPQTR